MKLAWRTIAIITIIILLAISGFFIYQKWFKQKSSLENNPTSSSGAAALTIPKGILDNKYGFLSGGPEDAEAIKKRGALWVRPHPGPFLWDAMQKDGDSEINFGNTDKVVKKYQEEGLGILATLWPFADWEQGGNTDCKVSSQDEFLPKNDFKGRSDYLPAYRCNPNNWQLYQDWARSVVERYDGDGQGDMPGLKYPIKYWEVMNEPDLSGGPRLDFYAEKNAPTAYAELLIKTSEAIRSADAETKILIAGAAGGSDQFLNFYKIVFSNQKTHNAFDIANVHCISNDSYDSFNVEPYKKMLAEFNLDSKPIWVTEAEAMISPDADINATQVKNSTKKALELGTQRIFYTMYDFVTKVGGGEKPIIPGAKNIATEIDGSDAEKAYKIITNQ